MFGSAPTIFSVSDQMVLRSNIVFFITLFILWRMWNDFIFNGNLSSYSLAICCIQKQAIYFLYRISKGFQQSYYGHHFQPAQITRPIYY